jgi:hypothetical protein
MMRAASAPFSAAERARASGCCILATCGFLSQSGGRRAMRAILGAGIQRGGKCRSLSLSSLRAPRPSIETPTAAALGDARGASAAAPGSPRGRPGTRSPARLTYRLPTGMRGAACIATDQAAIGGLAALKGTPSSKGLGAARAVERGNPGDLPAAVSTISAPSSVPQKPRRARGQPQIFMTMGPFVRDSVGKSAH